MMAHVSERVKLFRFVRDIPYSIALSENEQDYCCATKTPMLQKLLASIGIKSRRIHCRFEWKNFGLPKEIFAKATSPECGHEYLEVLIPENDKWVTVDPTWDSAIKTTGLPIAEWDGTNATSIGVKAVKTHSPEESEQIIKETAALSPEVWRKFFDANREFLGAINQWLAQHRQTAGRAST